MTRMIEEIQTLMTIIATCNSKKRRKNDCSNINNGNKIEYNSYYQNNNDNNNDNKVVRAVPCHRFTPFIYN